MKQILKHIINTSVLFLTGIVLAGCSSSEAPIEQPINPTGKYTMTVNASKGSDATTRALSIDGEGKLIAYWDGTEKVTVKEGATTLGTLTTITPDATDNTKAKLSGTLDKAPSGTSLTLELCSPTYGSQDGTLAYIASNCDYAIATTTVTYDNDNKTITGNASFINQQAIVKFTLQNAKGESLAVDNLTFSTTGDITITPTSATDVIYAALRGVDNTLVTLTATKGSDTYTCITKNVTFENGKYYRVTAKMKPQPLTLEAIAAGNITFANNSGGKVQYRLNNGPWTPLGGTITVKAKDKVCFQGKNASYWPGSDPSIISCNSPCYIYGNIMSLVDSINYATETSLTANDTFRGFFENNTNLRNDPVKDLQLPATTLRNGCYKSMFAGCTGLTRAPVLPAPTLVANCYAFMFDGCTGLTKAPDLPAPTLVDNCYQCMFRGCSSLAYIKCLATSISATDCTSQWVEGVTKTEGTFVKATSANWSTGNNGIPSTSPPWTVTSE